MSDINIVQKTQRLIIDMPSRSVSIINAGPQGPPGPISGISQSEFDTLVTRVTALEARVLELENP